MDADVQVDATESSYPLRKDTCRSRRWSMATISRAAGAMPGDHFAPMSMPSHMGVALSECSSSRCIASRAISHHRNVRQQGVDSGHEVYRHAQPMCPFLPAFDASEQLLGGDAA